MAFYVFLATDKATFATPAITTFEADAIAAFTNNTALIFALRLFAVLIHEYRLTIRILQRGDEPAAALLYRYNHTVLSPICLPSLAGWGEFFNLVTINSRFIKLKCSKFNIVHTIKTTLLQMVIRYMPLLLVRHLHRTARIETSRTANHDQLLSFSR